MLETIQYLRAIQKKALTSLLLFWAFNATAEISYSATLASDYVFEGVSQTLNDPAIQGSIDYSHDSGFYAGTWGSNVDFGDDASGMELDIFAGFAGDFNDSISFDVGYVDYSYHGDDGLDGFDFAELYGSLTFMENTTVYAWLADDDAVGGNSTRLKVAHTIELANEYSLNLAYHHWTSDDPEIWLGDDSYDNYLIGIAKTFNGFDFELNYTDTSLNGWDEADGRLTLSVTKSFD